VLRKGIIFLLPVLAAAQSTPQQPPLSQTPPVKVNILNVCTPSAEEQKELSSSLEKVPGKPGFGRDFEVARGRSTMDAGTTIPGLGGTPTAESSTADWVRVRREFPAGAMLSNAQYSFSVDGKNMVETLVLHVRDPKDVMQISIEDSASAVTSPAAMLGANTPVSRVKLERFGKSSVVLARCAASGNNPPPDQSAYEPIFKAASSLMNHYRDALGVRTMVPQELARVAGHPAGKAGSAAPKKSQ
jgi:hypothetical protein